MRAREWEGEREGEKRIIKEAKKHEFDEKAKLSTKESCTDVSKISYEPNLRRVILQTNIEIIGIYRKEIDGSRGTEIVNGSEKRSRWQTSERKYKASDEIQKSKKYLMTSMPSESTR